MRWNLFWSRIFFIPAFLQNLRRNLKNFLIKRAGDWNWNMYDFKKDFIALCVFHITSYAYVLCHTTQQILLHMQISTWQKPCNDFLPFRTVNCYCWSLISLVVFNCIPTRKFLFKKKTFITRVIFLSNHIIIYLAVPI